MRSIRNIALVLLATALAVAGMTAPALANTELVPGSRLVFPYIDISSGRETFLLITNSGNFNAPVHVEFYAQTCAPTDRRVDLTAKDIAAIQVSKTVTQANFPAVSGSSFQQNIAGIGWADLDVRGHESVFNVVYGACGPSLAGCPSVEYNGLMGTAVIIDIGGDFAFAYPAAASQGSSGEGFLTTTGGFPSGQIVSRDASALATRWFGTYETYPDTLLVPAFFAEDLCAAPVPVPLRAFVSFVGPADAWRKEAPGSNLGGTTAVLVNVQNSVAYDGAENTASITFSAHHVNGRLCTVSLESIRARSQYDITPGQYATSDETLGAKNQIGWMELKNLAPTPVSASTGPNPNPSFATAVGFDSSGRNRGMVGLLFEIQAGDFCTGIPGCAAADRLNTGDAIRAWADGASQIDWPCFSTEGTTGIRPPTTAAGSAGNTNAPTCLAGATPVAPSWLGDHQMTINGNLGVLRGQL
jgi:hypothetical protein